MKFLIQVLLIILLAFVLELFLPWWSIAIAGFLAGLLLNTQANFLAGLLGIGLLWTLTALYIESNAAAPLVDRVASIFSLSKPLLFAVTAFVGGLVGGFSAMAGSALRKSRRRGYYY
jgi:hypothetical protein